MIQNKLHQNGIILSHNDAVLNAKIEAIVYTKFLVNPTKLKRHFSNFQYEYKVSEQHKNISKMIERCNRYKRKKNKKTYKMKFFRLSVLL